MRMISLPSLQRAALIGGIVFAVLGVVGFIPGITLGGGGAHKLFDLFLVNGAHNVLHVLSGVFLLLMARKDRHTRLGFQILAILYALITIIGFILGGGNDVFGLIAVNIADNYLNLVLTLVCIYFGYAAAARHAETEPPSIPRATTD